MTDPAKSDTPKEGDPADAAANPSATPTPAGTPFAAYKTGDDYQGWAKIARSLPSEGGDPAGTGPNSSGVKPFAAYKIR